MKYEKKVRGARREARADLVQNTVYRLSTDNCQPATKMNAKRPPRNQKIYEKGACYFFIAHLNVDVRNATVNCQPTTVNQINVEC